MTFEEFALGIIKKHNVKATLEDVIKAIKIEYEQQARENAINNVGVASIDSETLESIIIETPDILARAEKEKKKTSSTVKAVSTKKTSKPQNKKEKGGSLISGDDETLKEFEQLGLFS